MSICTSFTDSSALPTPPSFEDELKQRTAAAKEASEKARREARQLNLAEFKKKLEAAVPVIRRRLERGADQEMSNYPIWLNDVAECEISKRLTNSIEVDERTIVCDVINSIGIKWDFGKEGVQRCNYNSIRFYW